MEINEVNTKGKTLQGILCGECSINSSALGVLMFVTMQEASKGQKQTQP